jgi:DNA-directed RNA polymerase subunit RPC12/RpoP
VIVRAIIALAIGLSVFWLGRTALRAATAGSPRPRDEGPPEDVEDLDVFFVCAECGTEFQVTRLGEAQVPRHCGEKMQVVRRPRQAPPASLN